MSRSHKQLIPTIILLALPLFLCAQQTHLKFQGLLSDFHKDPIANESFSLSIELIPAKSPTAVWSNTIACSSSETGWFGFDIENMEKWLSEEQGHDIKMVLLFRATEPTGWIKEGEDFELSYTFKASQSAGLNAIVITRTDGAELIKHGEDDFAAFKDSYPFGYITGGFMLSQVPLDQERANADLREWIIPGKSPEGPSRAVKGGFHSGGYRKRN